VLLALGLPTRRASAQPLRYHLKLDAARAVTGHQANEFGWGTGVFGAGELPLFRQLGFELEFGGIWLSEGRPPSNPMYQAQGAASGLTAALGLRVHPFLGEARPATFSLGGLWLSAGAGATSTKNVLAPTLNANLGYNAQLTEHFALGPTVGLAHIFQPNTALRPDDANLLLVGLQGTFDTEEAAGASDRDHDGLNDDKDRCPDKAEDPDGFEDGDGCPEFDNDKDGVLDAIDKCPLAPEDKDGFEDADGCPDPDNDQDGIPDAKDRCPLEAEDKDGFEDGDGCPDPDNDQDGVLDAQDQCPDEAETLNGYADTDGCPDDQDIRVVGDKIVLDDRVHFWKNSHLIRNESDDLLRRVAKLIKEHPEYIRVEIEGHTDSRGPDKYNKPLSERRAEQVMNVLVENGVEAWRLGSAGFGEEQPLVEGDSEYSMWMNRRVDFRITRRPLPAKLPEAAATPGAPQAAEKPEKSSEESPDEGEEP